MTPDDLVALKGAGSVKRRVELLLGMWHRVRAVVRVMCGYTPEVLRGMSWEEYRQAYSDSIYFRTKIDN
ncbi:MAG: hypothetical protein IJ524_03385 [Bacteroidales bacterium]|nr:hypothetical protein [Bacteroidales bacterium]MBR6131009.1 hypothetical protein [Bacteroidales bacterium]